LTEIGCLWPDLYRPRRGGPSKATVPRPFKSANSRFTVAGEAFIREAIAGTRQAHVSGDATL
jgi:hypothetical protein